MMEFLSMGGYGFYVWGSYLVTAALIVGEVIAVRARSRAARAAAGDSDSGGAR